MTPADEALFIQLWQQGIDSAAIGQQLGIPRGTVSSRAATLVRRGKIQPRPRGGSYPKQPALTRLSPDGSSPPATPAPPAAERKEIQPCTVRLSKALIEHLKAVAYERRMPPSELVEALVWKALTDH